MMDWLHQVRSGLAGEGFLPVVMGLTGSGLILLVGIVLILSLKKSLKKRSKPKTAAPRPSAEAPAETASLQPAFPVELFQDVIARLDRLESEMAGLKNAVIERAAAAAALPPAVAAAQAPPEEPAAVLPAAAPLAEPPQAAPASMNPKTAVICDDDGTLRQIYLHILKKQGFAVETGADGQQGLDAIHAVRPSLVILDLDMPVKGGLQVLRDLKTEGFVGPYIIILSARENPDLHAEVRALGASEVMVKPFSPPVLVKKIETLVQEGKI